MKEIDVLRELFDEKIIEVTSVFLENPSKQFSLTEVARLSHVHTTTTLRIISRLVKKSIVKVNYIGKSKFYQLKAGEKAMALFKFLKKEGDHISEFIDKISQSPKIKKIVLENKDGKSAKLLIIGNSLPTEKIKELVQEIQSKEGFKINFVEISEKQFEEMERLGLYDLRNKLIWEKIKVS